MKEARLSTWIHLELTISWGDFQAAPYCPCTASKVVEMAGAAAGTTIRVHVCLFHYFLTPKYNSIEESELENYRSLALHDLTDYR